MVLKEQELLQIDELFLRRLQEHDSDALVGLSIKLTSDLKEALERLNQNPSNSSKPSGSLAPWDKATTEEEDDESTIDEKDALRSGIDIDKEEPTTTINNEEEDSSQSTESTKPKESRKPGRQPGSQGFGRTQKIEITHTIHHSCGGCIICNTDLTSVEKAYTGFQSVNINFGSANAPGLQLTNTLHIYYSGLCPGCGLENQSEPWRAPPDESDWKNVGMTEWRLVGPDLAALIVYLSMDTRATRRKVKQFLLDVFGLELCIGTIQNCIVESARALEPVEEQLIEDLRDELLMYADETSLNEAKKRLWLWVFMTSATALFLVGYRTKEIFTNLFDAFTPEFDGYLMTDGYRLYRTYQKRLRCWAHLLRKAQGLCDSYTTASKSYGKQVLDILNSLIDAVYQAREGPDKGKASISAHHQEQLNNLRKICEEMSTSSHKKTSELGREFLNDWEAIFRVLERPELPLTNNEAERALRHWVILRKITQGTRSEQGSRALALFASVFTTCRLRKSSPLLYIRDVINQRRQGKDLPELPQLPAMVAG
ncbi:MAG: IS66 family transposase [Methyloprofundus sp.]|nr:IS66 family transposase [Methyloprofundus sp.]